MVAFCDCCQQECELSRCWAPGGIETFACDECRDLLFPTAEQIIERQRGRNTIGDRPGAEINTKRNHWGWQ